MAARRSSLVDIDNDSRFVISENYMVFYRHIDAVLYVDRILSARRDYLQVLFDNSYAP